jgi:hypothetical protein
MWQSSDLERKIFMRPTNCIFCGVALTLPGAQQPDSSTKEHVYARWFRDNVVNQKIKFNGHCGRTTDSACGEGSLVLPCFSLPFRVVFRLC